MDINDLAPTVISAIQAVLGRPIIAFGISGSAAADLANNRQDIDCVAITNSDRRGRLRFNLREWELDVFQETPASIRQELEQPRRAATMRLLSAVRIIYDRDRLLADANALAQDWLSKPAPQSVFGSEFSIVESARDLHKHYCDADGDTRLLLRGVLIGHIIDLCLLTAGIWPMPLKLVGREIARANEVTGALLSRAIRGDDVAMTELLVSVLPQGRDRSNDLGKEIGNLRGFRISS